MKYQMSITLAIICACSTAFGRDPVPMKWTIENAEREALVFPPLTSITKQGKPCGVGCTLYPSAVGAPVETLVHPGKSRLSVGGSGVDREIFPGTPAQPVRLSTDRRRVITLDE
jgi:hypothetical protein